MTCGHILFDLDKLELQKGHNPSALRADLRTIAFAVNEAQERIQTHEPNPHSKPYRLASPPTP